MTRPDAVSTAPAHGTMNAFVGCDADVDRDVKVKGQQFNSSTSLLPAYSSHYYTIMHPAARECSNVRPVPERVPVDVMSNSDSTQSSPMFNNNDCFNIAGDQSGHLRQSTLLSLERLIKALESLGVDDGARQDSATSDEEEVLRGDEEETPGVAFDDEANHGPESNFAHTVDKIPVRWIEHKTKTGFTSCGNPLFTSLECSGDSKNGKTLPLLSEGVKMMHGQGIASPPSDHNTEGYGADLEDSPCRGPDQRRKREGVQIHPLHSSGPLSRPKKGEKLPASMLLPPKEYRSAEQSRADEQHQQLQQSSTVRKRSVTFTTPDKMVEEMVNVNAWGDPFASLNPFNSRHIHYSPSYRPRPRALTTPPFSPCLAPLQKEPAETAEKRPMTRLQTRRPPSLHLGPLPTAGAQWNISSAPLLSDAYSKQQREQQQQQQQQPQQPGKFIGVAPRRPSVAPIMLPRRSSRSTSGPRATQHIPEEDTSPPPPGGFPIPISIRLRGLNAPDSAEIEESMEKPQENVEAEVTNGVVALPVHKRHSVKIWALGTFEATVVQGEDKVNSPASAKHFQSPPPSGSTNASEWKQVAIEDRSQSRAAWTTTSNADERLAEVGLSSGFDENLVTRLDMITSAAVTTASTSGIEDAMSASASAPMMRSRRYASGAQDMVSPMPLRPVRIPSVGVAASRVPAKPSPIKRVFNHLPWRNSHHQQHQEKLMESSLPGTWLSSRSPGHCGDGRARLFSGPAAIRHVSMGNVPGPSWGASKQQRPVSSFFHRNKAALSPQTAHYPHSPLHCHAVTTCYRGDYDDGDDVNDDDDKNDCSGSRGGPATVIGLGLSLGSPNPTNSPDMPGQQSCKPSPLLIDLSSPILPTHSVTQSLLLATNVAATTMYLQ